MNNEYNNKKTLVDNLTFLNQYKNTYCMYFVTLTFKLKQRKFNEPSIYKKENFDEYFKLFKNRLNRLSLRHSRQINKCAFIAFPEQSHYTQKSLNQEEIISLNQNRQLPTFSNRDLPQHYHCIFLITNQHKNRFERKCMIKALGSKNKLSRDLHYPYPKKMFNEPQNLIIQDTDIQVIDNIDGVINYSTKNFLKPSL